MVIGGSATANVTINNFAFSPTTVSVAPGGKVTWKNIDGGKDEERPAIFHGQNNLRTSTASQIGEMYYSNLRSNLAAHHHFIGAMFFKKKSSIKFPRFL